MSTPSRIGAVAFVLAGFLASGPSVHAASKDMERLQIQMATLQSQLNELQRVVGENARELKRVSDLLGEQNAALKKMLHDQKLDSEATQVTLKEVTERLEEIRDRLTGAAGAPAPAGSPATLPSVGNSGGATPGAPAPTAGTPTGGAPLPGELFSQAYADYTRGQYELALQEFREYLKRFPDNDRADDAQYWIGVSLSGKQQFAEAVEAWDRLLQDFPSSDKLPDAYVKKGGALEKLGRRREALTQYRYVVEHYPNAPAAKIARDKLSPQ